MQRLQDWPQPRPKQLVDLLREVKTGGSQAAHTSAMRRLKDMTGKSEEECADALFKAYNNVDVAAGYLMDLPDGDSSAEDSQIVTLKCQEGTPPAGVSKTAVCDGAPITATVDLPVEGIPSPEGHGVASSADMPSTLSSTEQQLATQPDERKQRQTCENTAAADCGPDADSAQASVAGVATGKTVATATDRMSQQDSTGRDFDSGTQDANADPRAVGPNYAFYSGALAIHSEFSVSDADCNVPSLPCLAITSKRWGLGSKILTFHGTVDDFHEAFGGRTAFCYRQLEGRHDYIQWLFPSPQPSAFNAQSAPLTPAEAERIGSDCKARSRALRCAMLSIDHSC